MSLAKKQKEKNSYKKMVDARTHRDWWVNQLISFFFSSLRVDFQFAIFSFNTQSKYELLPTKWLTVCVWYRLAIHWTECRVHVSDTFIFPLLFVCYSGSDTATSETYNVCRGNGVCDCQRWRVLILVRDRNCSIVSHSATNKTVICELIL